MKVIARTWMIYIMLTILLISGCDGMNSEKEDLANNADVVIDHQDDGEPYSLSILLTNHTEQPMTKDSEVWKAIEQYTNTDLDIQWVPNTNYMEKVYITLASGKLPTIMLVDPKMSSVINAARNDVFWDLTPYLDDYPNLSQSNEQILHNIAIDGNIYGIYRSRILGRFGISFRQDWLDNLHLSEPQTIYDFYDMLWAFTYEDPDGNGVDDTYGMTITKYNGPWNVMQTWFGVPNEWGFDEEGNLIPEFMTEAYLDAHRFFRRLYEDGLVNQDFAYLDSAKWTESYMNEEAGVIVDVVEFSTTFQTRFENDLGYTDQVWNIIGAVEGPQGLRNLSFESGYNGMFAITREGAPTEEDLRKALNYLDKMNDYEMQVLIMYGILDRQYKIDGDGYYEIIDDNDYTDELADAAQLGMGLPQDFRYDPDMPVKRTPLMLERNQVCLDNEKILVTNPCEAFISDTYAKKGEQLDSIIENARIQWIVGKIDEGGFLSAVKQWREQGGDAIIAEYNEAYKEATK